MKINAKDNKRKHNNSQEKTDKNTDISNLYKPTEKKIKRFPRINSSLVPIKKNIKSCISLKINSFILVDY